MHSSKRHRFCAWTFIALIFAVGLSAATAAFPVDESQTPPQAPPAAILAHKNYFVWNPLDMLFSGRFSVGGERIFRLGDRYFGVYAQYTSPMNSVFNGMVTAHQKNVALSDEFQFPSGFDVYLCYHGKGRTRTMRYFPRIGLSFLNNPGVSETATYVAFGPCGRFAFGKNFNVTFALTTLKIKLKGSKDYNWLQLPLFDFMVGIDF